jgi:putative ATP-dependent endonuclease of OLD family
MFKNGGELMKIENVKINNYRNLDGLNLRLDPLSNFLVGENDLGKSNFLDLLDKIFNGRFNEGDFNEKEDIKVDFSILLNNSELGLFEDLFDPNEGNKINITAQMGLNDDYIDYHHVETNETIQKKDLKCANFIKYSSLRKPSEELDFYKRRGVGKLLHFMVKKILEDVSDPDLINKEFAESVVGKINNNFSKIRVFDEFGIETSIEEDPIDLISRVLSIKDSKDMHITKIGHGVQFSVLIILTILEKLMKIMETNLSKKCIFEQDGVKCISLILGLDEPEIHLHPYRQRNLIKYILNLINNEDENFSSLIKEIFDVDKIIGQSIVVTHSPNILTDDYKQITRFYQKNGSVRVKCGTNIILDNKLRKHLLKNIPYIKEAFFSRCNILVEGDSEFGAFPVFAERMDVDLDKLGISIIQAGSADSIPPLAKLLNLFDIHNVGIMDQDKFQVYETDVRSDGINLHSTAYDDFEEEIYNSFKIEDYIKFVEENEPQNKCFFNNKARRLGITIDCSQKNLFNQVETLSIPQRFQLKQSLKTDCINSLKDNKTVIFGKDLAAHVSKVPNSYGNLLKKAKRLANE